MATTYYVQPGASTDNSGGTDADDSAARSGQDGVGNGTTTFTSASANFAAGDVGRGIWVGTPVWALISSVSNSTTVVLSQTIPSSSGLSWKIGGTWKTLTHAVHYSTSGRNKVNGDVINLGPGIFRETVSFGITSPTAEVSIIGDPLNALRFKDSDGNLIAQGPVILTNLLTSDAANSTNTNTVDCNGKSFLTFQRLWIESMSAAKALAISAACTNITLRDCCITSLAGNAIDITTTAGTTATHLIERCVIGALGSANGVTINAAKHTSEYDMGIVVRNSNILAGAFGIYVQTTGSGTNYGTGVTAQNCTLTANTCFVTGTGYAAALTTPLLCKNCLIIGPGGIKQNGSTTPDIILEDYNFLVCTTARINIGTAGSNDIAYGSNVFARSVRHDLGQSELFGFARKSFMAPWSTSRTIGYGNDSTPTALAVDLWNRVKPSGSGVAAASVLSSVGAHELHEYGTQDTTTKFSSIASNKLFGPGDHEIYIAVSNEANTISIKVRYESSSYGGTNYPQVMLLDNEGFANISNNSETRTASAAASDAWETLTFTSFTPSRKGVIRMRFISRDTSGVGNCWFDSLNIV